MRINSTSRKARKREKREKATKKKKVHKREKCRREGSKMMRYVSKGRGEKEIKKKT